MQISIPKECDPLEKRTPVLPDTVLRLIKLGARVALESGVGLGCREADQAYQAQGAEISSDRKALFSRADLIMRLRPPSLEEVSWLKKGSLHISFLDPFQSPQLIQALAHQGVSAVSLEMIPRSTRAQKMDVLSSQASLAGYAAILLAANHLPKILPMMTTPSGTIPPARVFVIGAGVAGLQAIATARRLGARVEAFDTRPAVAEQIQSLGAKFLKIDLGQTGETRGGHATELTEDQLKKQREGIKRVCLDADIVVTTAQVFGKKAPVIVTHDMISAMKPGSVIVDLAVESGGNVEGVKKDELVEKEGVKILGLTDMPSRVCRDASRMISHNILSLIEEFWDPNKKNLRLNLEDDIIKGCLLTHGGEIVHPLFINHNSP